MLENFVRSGIRTHASKWRPEHSYAETAQAMLESGALDRSAILTWNILEFWHSIKTLKILIDRNGFQIGASD